ncbi:MAG: arylesterase [Proteobacteria bacterium]|nr:arylesterase [Pseudomonadota bacterium]
MRWLLWLVLLAFPAGAAAAEPIQVVCLGDSLTEGYGVAAEEAYPARVERRLHAEGRTQVRLVNAGISGSTSASGLARLRWQLRADPQILLLALGANDGLRGFDLQVTRRNLSQVIRHAQDSGLLVLLAGMKLPPNYGPDYAREFERMFPSLAEEHSVALIPFLLEGVAGDPALNLPDGIHPNAEGHARVAETVYRYLLPHL